MGALLMIVDAGAIVAGRLDRQGIDNDNNLKPTITGAATDRKRGK